MKTNRLIGFCLANIILLGCIPLLHAQKKENEKMVQIVTDFGKIKLRLYNETPLHRDNFIRLAESGQLNGSTFHRIIKTFMIQGGSAPGSGGQENIGADIPAEFVAKYHHKRGALAAARTGDDVNPQRKSAGSQFYIVHGRKFTDADLDMGEKNMKTTFSKEQRADYTTIGGAPHLDGAYTVFGEVVEGMDVVDKIAEVPVTGDRPNAEIKMTVSVVK